MKNSFFIGVIVCLLGLTPIAFAESAQPIKQIPFNEGDQLSLPLSAVDVNRLVVRNDLISAITCPANLCVTRQDKTGSAYITLNTSTTFTLFTVTESGRHLSMLVVPSKEPGFTYEFVPTGKSDNAVHWEEEGAYTDRLVDLLRDMMRGELPRGYGYHEIPHAKSFSFKKAASFTLIAEYQGEHWRGEVYEVHNNSKKSLLLTPNGFYESGVKAVALSKQTLVPGETGYVYEVKGMEVLS